MSVDGVDAPYKQERSAFVRKVATAYYYLARPQEGVRQRLELPILLRL